MRAGAAILSVCVIGACGGSAATISDPDGGASSSASSSSTSSSSSSSGGSSSGDAATDAKKDVAREANAPGCPAAFADEPRHEAVLVGPDEADKLPHPTLVYLPC